MASIGIDIGTYNLCAVVSNRNRPIIIRDPQTGKETIPSMIRYKQDGSVDAVGSVVYDTYEYDKRVVRCVKRIIGYKMNTPEMRDYQKHCIQKVVEGRDGFPRFVMGDLKDESFTPVKITTDMIQYIVDLAKRSTELQFDEMVITVPAFFTQKQRADTKEAAAKTGVCKQDKIRLVSEPVAAALHYGMVTKQKQKFMVIDFGGGTTDICIMAIDDNRFDVIGTKGDRCLGGEDITNELVQFLQEKYRRNNDAEMIDVPSTSPNYLHLFEKLKRKVEEAKLSLSTTERVDVDISDLLGGNLPEDSGSDDDEDVFEEIDERPTTITLRRDEMNKAINNHLNRVVGLSRLALQENGLTKYDIDKVILVGGSCRLLALQEHIREEYGNLVVYEEQYLDTAVALGAQLATRYSLDATQINLTEIVPYHYGIICDNYQRDIFDPIIPKGTKFPTDQVFSIRRFIPDADPKRSPILGIEVPFRRSEDGDTYTGNTPPLVIEADNVPKNFIDIHLTLDPDGIIYFEAIQGCDQKVVIPKEEVCCVNADL